MYKELIFIIKNHSTIKCIICGNNEILEKRDIEKGRKVCKNRSCINKYIAIKNANKYIHKCFACGTEFFSSRKNSKFCSDNCRKKRCELECVVCGKIFRAKKKDVKTCSNDCRTKYIKSNNIIKLKCKECKCEFERPSFAVADKNNVFCSKKCGNKWHVQKNYGTFNRYGEDWYFIKKDVLQYYDNTCQRCGVRQDDSNPLHIHHCVPFKYFKNVNDANNFENLIPLCKNCHTRTHSENKEWYKETFGGKKI